MERKYKGFNTKEPWYILTNFDDLDISILAYQKRFSIEEMFRDFKLGGYSEDQFFCDHKHMPLYKKGF